MAKDADAEKEKAKEQLKRFKANAKELGVDEDPEAFSDALKKILAAKDSGSLA